MAQSAERRIVLVSGAPGAGKTTLARPLAEALGFPLVSKDDIKEALFRALRPAQEKSGDLEFSRKLSVAAMEVLWAIAERCPRVVLEANFRPASDYERGKIAGMRGRKVEVYCRLPLAEAARRFAERAARPGHHGAHALKTMPAERMAEYDRPIGLSPVIEVDTSAPVDAVQLANRIRDTWNG